MYTKTSLTNVPRIELHDLLKLTGAEISINTLAKGTNVPFIHYHKENEEIYGILDGFGYVILDGEKVELKKGDWFMVSPKTHRQIFASQDNDLTYICIQVKEHSLTSYTMTDGVIVE